MSAPDLNPDRPVDPHTEGFEPALDALLAAAFGPEPTPGGWTQPPLLRDEPSAHSPLVQPSSAEMPRGPADRYQMLGEIARGGMGVVLKGRDPDLGRDLAFKVLRTEMANRPAAVQRFVEEAQVGGQLQHPGIVPVYDLGRFADGRPYFAMKLVKGRTLADLLADRPDPATDRGRFLRHFLQVCQTLAYAHSRGVMHRDLKPANVMVGAFDEVLVMDWGLAKVLLRGGVADEKKASQLPPEDHLPTEIRTARFGSGSETEAGTVLGTPAFMAPEQAGGEIDRLDERADVFGLGAILAVILTGRPPYVGSGEVVRLMAVRGQLGDCFARLDGCGADAELVALCKRCLSAERDARPRTAAEVSAALAGHLAAVEDRAKRAELARAAAEAEAKEQKKRRKVQLLLAAAVGLLAVGGAAVGWYTDRQAAERQAERERLVAEQREADLRRQFEDEQRAAAERDRRQRNASAVAGLLDQCTTALRAGDADKAAITLEAASKRTAEGGADEHAGRQERLTADLAVLRKLTRADQFRWTRVASNWPDPKEAAEQYRLALVEFGADPDAVDPEVVARRVSASAVRERLVSALDRVLRADHSPRVRAALRAADADPYRDAVRDAVLANDGAKLLDLAGRGQAEQQPPGFVAFLGESGAIPVKRRRELLAAAVQRRPGDLGLLMALGRTYPINTRDGADERLRWFQAAVAVAPANSATHYSLGTTLVDKGKYDAAIASCKEAIRLDPKDAKAHSNLGHALVAKKEYDAAIASYREAIRLDPKLAPAHNNLGLALASKKEYDAAIASYREAIRLEPKLALAHSNLGNALHGKKEYDAAIASCKEAIRLDPKLAPAHNNLGLALANKKEYDAAIASCKEAIRLDPKLAPAHYNLGNALLAKKAYDAAIASYREAIRLEPKHANTHNNLGLALASKKEYDAAIACYKEAIRLEPKDAPVHNNLGVSLAIKQDYDAAIANFREAIRLNPKLVFAHVNLRKALSLKKDYEGAIAANEAHIRVEPQNEHLRLELISRYRYLKKYPEAVAAARAALQVFPRSAALYAALGDVLRLSGDIPGARAALTEATRLDKRWAAELEKLPKGK